MKSAVPPYDQAADDAAGGPLRVAVVGGSIAGCAAAIAAYRAGCPITVYERSSGELAERGFGLALAPPVHAELVHTGYLSPTAPVLECNRRLWLTRTADGGWRELWHQPVQLLTANWGQLWRSLRAEVPSAAYRNGWPVAAAEPADDGRAVVRMPDGSDAPYDLVVGADGYRSVVRACVAPECAPAAAGYVMVRGVTPLAELDDPELAETLDGSVLTAMFAGGHVVVYLIPGDGDGPRVNWVMYARPAHDIPFDAGQAGFVPGGLHDDLIRWAGDLAHRSLPDRIARLLTGTPTAAMGVQPVFDLAAPTLGHSPFVLAGDAGALPRPHAASGAVKALQDALCLERVLRSATSPGEAAESYAAERTRAGHDIVELGRRIGRDQVEATPQWAAMRPDEVSAYIAAAFGDQAHYIRPGEP